MTSHKAAALMASFRPHLIPLERNLTAAVFPLMKIIPAEFCVRQARAEGALTPDSLVIESSSGTMALGLAIVCNWYGLKLTIVSYYACDDALCRRLRDLGATVERVPAAAAVGGYQRARLDRLHEIAATERRAWWVNQYHNVCNAGAYSGVAAQIVEALGHVDCLVGAVGSGGSACGTAKFLRVLFPDMRLVAVDTFNSVLFGQPDGPRTLRGLGNSLMPGNLDHRMIDEVHWVTAAEAYAATRDLHRRSSLFRGGTSGAVWLVARHWAAAHPDATVVCLFADDGTRQAHEIYDDAYLTEHGLWLDRLPAQPLIVNGPEAAAGSWSMFAWNRRTYDAAVAQHA